MKKKFGLFALVLGLVLCASLFLFAACAGEEEDDSTGTPAAISVTVNGEGQTSGATINGDTEDVYTISASVSSGSSVTITYVVGDGAAESFTGNSFAPDAAGTYVFTFKAEEAADFTLTFVIAKGHTHTYGEWTVLEGDEPFVGEAGTATGTCSCGSTTTRELPAMTDDNANQEVTTPTVGKYSFNFTQQGSCTQETITEITYKFEDGVTVTFTLKQPPFEHSYSEVEVEYDAATMNTAWSAKAYCDLGCGTSVEVDNIPAVVISDESVWVWDEGGDHKLPTCGEGGYATYYYSGLELSDGTPIKVFVTNVPLPATGEHSYGKLVYSGSTVTVTCEVCETASVSATVTIGGGDSATGTTEFGSDAFSFADGTFTVTLPQNAFEKDGFAFSGWLVGEETKQAGESVTVAANGTLTITAQWKEITKPTITAQASATEIYVGGQVTLTWSLVGGEGEVTVTYTKNDVAADILKPVSGEAFAINEVGVYKFTFKAAEADDVTITVTVKEKPVISLTVDEESMENGEKYPVDICVDTQISYEAAVTGDGAVSASYKVDSGEAVSLEESGNFTFTKVGTYVFTITAVGADTFTYTVKVVAHSGTYAYDAEKGAVVFTCGTCQKTIDCEITGLTVTGDPASAYVVDNGDETYTAYGFTVEAVYAGVDGNTVTDIFIPLNDEKLVVTVASIGGYKNATVTFKYDNKVQGVTETSSYAVYEQKVAAGQVTDAAIGDRLVPLGTYIGEFELRYSLSDIVRTGSDEDAGGCSWVITFDAGNEAYLVLREDNWIGMNFGRTEGQIVTEGGDLAQAAEISATFEGFTITNNAFWTELNDFNNPQFVITRSYADGTYTITVTISEGTKAVAISIVEPVANGNRMTVSLGSLTYNEKPNPSYKYSAVLDAEKGLTVSNVVAPSEAVSVIVGTSLEAALAGVSLTVSYDGSALTDTIFASEATVTDNGNYAADSPSTYTVGLTYLGKKVTVTITVAGANTTPLEFYKNNVVVSGDDLFAGTVSVKNTESLIAYSDQNLEGRIALSNKTDYASSWTGENSEFVAVKLDASRDFTLQYTADVYTDVIQFWKAPAFMVTDGADIATTLNAHAASLVVRADGWNGLSSNAGAQVTLNQSVAMTATTPSLWRYMVASSGNPTHISEKNDDLLAAAYYDGEITGVSSSWTVAYNAASHVFTVTVKVAEEIIWQFTASSTLVTGEQMVMYIGGEGTYMNNIQGTITYAAI